MKAIVFDTETTGLIFNRTMKLEKLPEVIEFYACLWDFKKKKLVREYDTLVKPRNYPIDAYTIKATKTKLSNALLKDAPSFSEVEPHIRKFLESADSIIAHNLSFDMEMISIELERLKLTEINWPKRRICTVEQTLHLKGKRMSLTKLHEHLFDGEAFPDAHRAKADVMALARVAQELFDKEII